MVYLTSRFLHLFLVMVAMGILDMTSSGQESAVYAAPLNPSTGRRNSEDALQAIASRSHRIASRTASSSSFANYRITEEEKSTHTLPLTKIDQYNQRGHALMLLQHHINRANLKLATMKGRELPTTQDLQAAMDRRKRDIIEGDVEKRSSSRHMSYLTSSSNRFAPNHGRIGVKLNQNAINITSSNTIEERSLDVDDYDDYEDLEDRSTTKKKSKKSKSKKKHHHTTSKKSAKTTKIAAKATTVSKKATSTSKSATKAPTSTSKAATKSTSTTTKVNKDAAKAANASGYQTAALAAADSDGVQSAKAVTASHSLGLAIEANDVGYIATVQIGSNSTNFRMLIDSGSADTWVPSSSCSGCGSTHQKLGAKVSSTYAKTSKDFSITYGTGSVSGFIGSDTMKVAGMTLKALPMALITTESSDFYDDSVPFDGLMGLAKKALANSGNPTPIDAMYTSKQVPATVMGYHLGRAADGNNDGEVTFGGVDGSKYSGSLVEIPNVSDEGFFEIAIQGVSFNGKAISGIASGSTAILDTGTTLMVAPPAAAKLIHAQIAGSKYTGGGGYTIPCNTTQQVSFTFGGRSWPLHSEDMLFLPVDDNDLNGACVSSISGGTVGSANEWLLGASFLKNVYFATNAKANVVGLGTLA